MVRDLVHGALFTRGGADLARTAIFVGGSDVEAAEAVLKAVTDVFFGGFRVSVMLDANGANTTASAAALAAVEGMGGSVEGVEVGRPGRDRPGRAPGGAVAVASWGRRSRSGRDRSTGRGKRRRPRSKPGRASPSTAFSTEPCPLELSVGMHDVSIVVAAGAAGAVLLARIRRGGA